MQKNIITKMPRINLNDYVPCRDAKIKTEVKVFDKDKIKLLLKKKSFSAEELIGN